jgi:hypothetical protein
MPGVFQLAANAQALRDIGKLVGWESEALLHHSQKVNLLAWRGRWQTLQQNVFIQYRDVEAVAVVMNYGIGLAHQFMDGFHHLPLTLANRADMHFLLAQPFRSPTQRIA